MLVNYLREEALLSQKDFIDNKCCTSNFDPCSLVSSIFAGIGHRDLPFKMYREGLALAYLL